MIMKKLMVTFSLSVFILGLAQAQAFQKQSLVGNVGLGFGWYGYGYSTTSIPAITLSLEKGVWDISNVGIISLGGIAGYKHTGFHYQVPPNYSDHWSWNDFLIAARAAIHPFFIKNDKVDLYGGVALGMRFETWKYSYFAAVPEYYTTHYSYGLFSIFAGCRYYFINNLAVFGELGYGLGYFTLGLSGKF